MESKETADFRNGDEAALNQIVAVRRKEQGGRRKEGERYKHSGAFQLTSKQHITTPPLPVNM
ncbi:hypothetical protein E2C01_072662 [Portunus trituberculatus]|uniref:Uncharacterized protein n=1 Tax=Portunus trituberculatus TaxID=210409 RepID=A0A5B7I0M0_PORTR|nr:hypothetical protein [Portunus trituberculatus]